MDRRMLLKAAGALGLTGTGIGIGASQENEGTNQASQNGTANQTQGDQAGREEGQQYRVNSTPENVVWGAIDPTKDPVLTVPDGATVEIETLSHEGILEDQGHPMEFFTSRGISEENVLDDHVAVYEEVPHDGAGPHVVTGPVYIEGAQPGDILEVEVQNIDFRVPYGTNTFRQRKGGLPAEFTWNDSRVIEFDLDRNVALFSDGAEIPLDPFFGDHGRWSHTNNGANELHSAGSLRRQHGH